MKTSMVFSYYNRKKQFEHSLERIFDFTIRPDEIIIVDDGSEDRADALAKRFNCKYFYLETKGYNIDSRAVNVGIKQSTGDLIIIAQPEMLQVTPATEQFIKYFEDGTLKYVIAKRIWSLGRKIYENLEETKFKHPAEIIKGLSFPPKRRPYENTVISGQDLDTGGLWAVPREYLMSINGYNEDFYLWGFNDYDIFDRLSFIDLTRIADPNIVFIHQWHERVTYFGDPLNTFGKNEKKAQEHMQQAKALLAKDPTQNKAALVQVNKGKEWGKL